MSGVWTVLLLALLPGAGNLLGGLLAELRRPSPRLLNHALHAASGIVLAIVAVELLPAALAILGGGWIGLAFLCGGGAYVLLEGVVERREAVAETSGRGRMWMIYAAVAVDLVCDGLMIGTGAAVSSGLAVLLAAGQVLADLPEGYATAATLRANAVPRRARLLLSASFVLYSVAAALGAWLLLRAAPPALRVATLVFAAGLLTVAAVEDMLEEAHAAESDRRASVLAFAGGFALFTVLSAGLEAALGA